MPPPYQHTGMVKYKSSPSPLRRDAGYRQALRRNLVYLPGDLSNGKAPGPCLRLETGLRFEGDGSYEAAGPISIL